MFIPFGLIIGLAVDGFEQPRHAGSTMDAIHVATAWVGTATSERVPFAGCESGRYDDDVPSPTPKDRGQAPALPRSVAHKLAYYALRGIGSARAMSWHCRGYEASDASTLVVTSEPLSAYSGEKPMGLGILLLNAIGWTGGGVGVVLDVATRLFPAKKEFLQGRIDAGPIDKSYYTFGPYPDDISTRRSDTDVEFETPANKDGMGTFYGLLVKNADPIRGWAIMSGPKNEAPSVMLLAVRMPPHLHRLVRPIMEIRWLHGSSGGRRRARFG